MNQIQNNIEYRIRQLKLFKISITSFDPKEAAGLALRISKCNHKPQYYCHKTDDDGNYTYIPKEKIKLIKQLAQHDYNLAVLNAIDYELKILTKCQNRYPEITAEEVYEALTTERKQLVEPLIELDETFISRWKNEKYEKKKGTDQYGFITKCGVKVKSKSELIIADNLYYNNIPYKYERPMKLKGIVVHPDFTILNTKTRREVIWEHFGMMDNPEYAQTAVRKKQDYNFEGYFEGDNLIITMETKNAQLNSKQIEMIIQRKFLSNIN